MAVTQYVGARYVPIFANPLDWSNTRTYEPLTIVLHNGNSYTSRQSVPTGIDISNEDYWALTGNYNAQIAQMQNQIDEINSKLNDLPAQKRRVILIGDSYLRTYTDNVGWGDLFIQKTGYEEVGRYKAGGAGFVTPGTSDTESGLTFSQMVDKAATDHASEVNSVDAIVVCGLLNDLQTGKEQAVIQSAISSLCANCRNKFPNATVYICTPLCSIEYIDNAVGIAVTYNLANVVNNGMVYATNSPFWFLGQVDSLGRGDDIHPNAAGYERLATFIADFVMGDTNVGNNGSISSAIINSAMQTDFPELLDAININSENLNVVGRVAMFNISYTIKDVTKFNDSVKSVPLPIPTYPVTNLVVAPAYITHGGSYYTSPKAVTIGASTTDAYGNIYMKVNPNFYSETGGKQTYANGDVVDVYFTVLMGVR